MKEPSVQQILQIVHHICLDTTAGVRHLWPVEYIKFKSTMKLQWRTTGVIHKHVVRTWSTVRATHAPSRSFSSDSSRASILKLIAWKKKHNGKVSESTFVRFTCMIFVYEPVFSKTETCINGGQRGCCWYNAFVTGVKTKVWTWLTFLRKSAFFFKCDR